jgi:hypothetical protein
MAKHDNCKADGCNTIVSDDNDFCRSCRAKLRSVAQELSNDKTSGYAGARVESSDPLTLDDLLDDASLEGALGIIDVSDPEVLKRLRMVRPAPPKPMNGYLPFHLPKSVPQDKDYTLVSQPQTFFKPEALMLWGYDDTTVIRGLYIGQQVQGAACFGDLPASFFGTAKTYEKLLEDMTKNGISPPNWITWNTCHLGANVVITVNGPLRHAVMLGKMSY